MSNQKQNTFDKLIDYFDDEEEEEEYEEEIYDDDQNNKNNYYTNPKLLKEQNINNSNNYNKNLDKKNSSLNVNQKQILNELYSNEQNNNKKNMFDCEQINNKIRDMKGKEFNNFKFSSFRPEIPNDDDANDELKAKEDTNINNQNQNDENNKIIEKVETNNWLINGDNNERVRKQSEKETIYNKILASQCSFGNMNDASHRSTSINTANLPENLHSSIFQENKEKKMQKPEILIKKSFDKLQNNNNKENIDNEKNNDINNIKNNKIQSDNFIPKENEKDWKIKKDLIKNNIDQIKKYMNHIKKNKSKSKSRSKSKSKEKKNNKNVEIPIELILFDDAKKKRQKMENIYQNTLSKIQLESIKSKINKNSYKIAIDHDDKKIESIINKYNKRNKLQIIDIALIFQELKIFRKLLQNININKLVNICDFNEFKNIISIVINEGDTRKIEELNFLEQTWILINPEKKNGIRKDIFEGLLKIIFSPVGNITEIANIVNQYLQAALFGDGIEQLNNRNNKMNDIAKLKNYIKKFLKLKENIIAYQELKNNNTEKYEKILKENYKNLTFEPNIPPNEDFHSSLNERRRNFNFDSLYNRFKEKERNKQYNLNQLMKNKIKEELKEVKQKPNITKNYGNYLNRDEEKDIIYEKLYKMDKSIKEKRQKIIEEKSKENKEKFEQELKSFKLNINSKIGRKRMAKSFDNKVKPKGFDEYVARNKKAILEKMKIKDMFEKITIGENYEKIRRRTITPFNITDMRKKNKKKNNRNGNEFFTLQIKIPIGKLKKIKIYKDDDANKIADEFCRIYSIKDNVKQKLIKNIIKYQNLYLKKIQTDNEGENFEEF